jgi:hypothetical protein
MAIQCRGHSLTTRTLSAPFFRSFIPSHPTMSQSCTPPDTGERRSSPASFSKASSSETPAADNPCPNLDDEVSAARGAGAFPSACLPCRTRSCCTHSMSCVDLAIPQKREREVSIEPTTPHPSDTVRVPNTRPWLSTCYSPLTAKVGTRACLARQSFAVPCEEESCAIHPR